LGPAKGLHLPSDSEESEDEDEETLQLKLQAIEARLKLKKLQNGKRKESSRPNTAASGRIDHSKTLEPSALLQPGLQVPVSPVKDRRPPKQPPSPARVILGIDKGLKARDVSLKRPTSSAAGNLSRLSSYRSSSQQETTAPKPKSFSERIAEGRMTAQEQAAKDERIEKSRSRGFGLPQDNDVFADSRTVSRETTASRSGAREEAATASLARRSAQDFQQRSRPASVASQTESAPSRTCSRTSNATSTQARASKLDSASNIRSGRPQLQERTSSFRKDGQDPAENPNEPLGAHPDAEPAEGSSTFEPYSSLHLTKRSLDHTKLTRTLHGKQIYTIPQLLKEVKSPHYDPPDCETDYIVLGIVASKSTPRDQKNNPKSINTAGSDEYNRPKFMALRLTDLKWEVDMYLFDTGFEKWWKLTEGTVIAVLNPGIMPPRNKDSGAFSLKVTSCEDTILEIGTAKDLGFCKSIKSDGHQCTQWIDKRKTEVCEFHIALQVDKARKGRMELNTMVGMTGKGGKKFGRGGKEELKREGKYHDKYLHETMYITPSGYGLNSASLLDEEDQRTLKGLEKKEAVRKRKREREKEDELARRLGSKGNGAGSEYLTYHRDVKRTTVTNGNGTTTSSMIPSSSTVSMASEPVDAEALGLLSNKAGLVSLSPVKGRKRGIPSSNNDGNSAPMGWGGAFKRGLLDKSPRKSSLKQDGADVSPRKKARLLLPEKGIRTPGRESLGGADIFLEQADEEDDDDDDLEIIKP
jgi:minichromosome maintenance protein 10